MGDASPRSPKKRSGLEQYEVLETIGEGTFGKVNKIRRKSDNEILCWKELYYGSMSEKEKQQLVAEVNILREMSHRNVVRYYDRIIVRAKKRIYIVMEYCSGGDLASLIKKRHREKKYIEEKFIWRVFAQVAVALNECHVRSSGVVVHRDLKPGNIFIAGDGCIKLGDFGLARTLSNSRDYAQTHVGTPYYMSPEQVLEAAYNQKSDIWSLGCLVYELAALAPPFRAANQLALAVKIQAGRFERIPAHYSSNLQRLCHVMLRVEAAKRPSISRLLRTSPIQKVVQEMDREFGGVGGGGGGRRKEKGEGREVAERERERRGSGEQGRADRLREREEAMARREAEVSAKEGSVAARERQVARRLAELEQREEKVRQREYRVLNTQIDRALRPPPSPSATSAADPVSRKAVAPPRAPAPAPGPTAAAAAAVPLSVSRESSLASGLSSFSSTHSSPAAAAAAVATPPAPPSATQSLEELLARLDAGSRGPAGGGAVRMPSVFDFSSLPTNAAPAPPAPAVTPYGGTGLGIRPLSPLSPLPLASASSAQPLHDQLRSNYGQNIHMLRRRDVTESQSHLVGDKTTIGVVADILQARAAFPASAFPASASATAAAAAAAAASGRGAGIGSGIGGMGWLGGKTDKDKENRGIASYSATAFNAYGNSLYNAPSQLHSSKERLKNKTAGDAGNTTTQQQYQYPSYGGIGGIAGEGSSKALYKAPDAGTTAAAREFHTPPGAAAQQPTTGR